MDGTSLGSCSMEGFVISGVEPSALVLVNTLMEAKRT
jgi:hypothetical protein